MIVLVLVCVSRNLPFSFSLSSLLIQLFLVLEIFHFLKVGNIVPFFLLSLFVNFVNLFEEPTHGFIGFPYLYQLHYFLLLVLDLLFFFPVPSRFRVQRFETFTNASIYSYILSLSTAFAASHTFWFLFSFISR